MRSNHITSVGTHTRKTQHYTCSALTLLQEVSFQEVSFHSLSFFSNRPFLRFLVSGARFLRFLVERMAPSDISCLCLSVILRPATAAVCP